MVNWCVSLALTTLVAVMTPHKLMAAFLGIVAGTAINFVLCRYVVFQHVEPLTKQPEANAPACTAEQHLMPTGER